MDSKPSVAKTENAQEQGYYAIFALLERQTSEWKINLTPFEKHRINS